METSREKKKKKSNFDEEGNCVGYGSTLDGLSSGRMQTIPYFFGFLHAARVVEKYELGTKKILDIACGNNELGMFLKQNFWYIDFTGVDISDRKQKVGKNLRFIKMDLKQKWEFEDKSFDAVFGIECIEHFEDKDLNYILSETTRVLSDDGILYIKTPNGATGKHFKDHPKEYTYDELKNKLVNLGFRIEKVYGFHSMEKMTKDNLSNHRDSILDFFPRSVTKTLLGIKEGISNSKWICIEARKEASV
jgi:ubiquinone/menaquinone biosynthesis C-methylase UbiE